MHELFHVVLNNKDLSKAGDLFIIPDTAVVSDLPEVVSKILEISSQPDYLHNDNDQSIVEICITRITSSVRETGSIESTASSLVSLMESCLNHDLKPIHPDEDPPHAKIASDIISCIFLNYNKKDVMKQALPIAVKFLHKGNKELSRNMASYLSLAALGHADLLAQHIQPIIDSVISGNYILAHVLPPIYSVNKDPLHEHVMALVSLLPLCDVNEKLALLSLFGLIAKNKPLLLESSLSQLCECLTMTSTALPTVQIFLDMLSVKAQSFCDQLNKLKRAADQNREMLPQVIKIFGAVGKLNKNRAREAIDYILLHLTLFESSNLGIPLKELVSLCHSYPSLLVERVVKEAEKCYDRSPVAAKGYIQHLINEYNAIKSSVVDQTTAGVTIVKIGGNKFDTGFKLDNQMVLNRNSVTPIGLTSKPRLNDSCWSSKLSISQMNRSLSHLGGAHHSSNRLSSSIGFHKSMSRLSSSQQIHKSLSVLGSKSPGSGTISSSRILSGCAISDVSTPPKYISAHNFQEDKLEISSPVASIGHSILMQNNSAFITHQKFSTSLSNSNSVSNCSILHNKLCSSRSQVSNTLSSLKESEGLNPGPASSNYQSDMTNASSDGENGNNDVKYSDTGDCVFEVTLRKPNNTTVTMITDLGQSVTGPVSTQRISVFEPYPMRDTVQYFCEKYLDKIKAYMQKVFVKLPLPVKCTIEERKNKKNARLHFACQEKGEHCLYNKQFFAMKTRNPRIWIHLMFLALQARGETALSSRDTSVSSLKHCWDTLKYDNKTFLTLITSAFPTAKDQETLVHELRNARFFDVFEYNGLNQQWGCFLCNHPDRVMGFLQDNQPVIEGQLKEKKGKWKIFRRWKTCYFTLSGGHLSYKGSKNTKDCIEVHQIQSVKTISRGVRNIPKAFEIFTNDKSLVLKPKDGKNAEEWVQCLSVAVAHSQSKMDRHTKVLTSRTTLLRTTV